MKKHFGPDIYFVTRFSKMFDCMYCDKVSAKLCQENVSSPFQQLKYLKK